MIHFKFTYSLRSLDHTPIEILSADIFAKDLEEAKQDFVRQFGSEAIVLKIVPVESL